MILEKTRLLGGGRLVLVVEARVPYPVHTYASANKEKYFISTTANNPTQHYCRCSRYLRYKSSRFESRCTQSAAIKYTTSVPAIYTIDKGMRLRISYVWSSSSVFERQKTCGSECWAESVNRQQRERRARIYKHRNSKAGWSSLLHIVELSASLAASGLSHAAARWLGGVLRRL